MTKVTTPGNTPDFEVDLRELLNIFQTKPLNMNRLREYGRVYGFGNQFGRNLAWNAIVEDLRSDKFLADDFDTMKEKAAKLETKHNYEHQIYIDVQRSLFCLDYFENLPNEEIEYHRNNLNEMLQTFFSFYQNYHYFQGFHDVGTILLFTLGQDAGLKAMQKLAYIYFRDALKYPFEKSVTLQLQLILRIVHKFDPWFSDVVSSFYQDVPIFALPWMLTWFSHSLKDMSTILRIFDYLICSPPYSVIYMCAAVLLTAREKLLGSNEELDMTVLHSFFQHLEIPNVELLIATTIEMEKKCDIYKLISALETPFPDQSFLMPEKHSKTINKYYTHQLQRKSKGGLISMSQKQRPLWKQQIFVGLIIGLLLVLFTMLSQSIFVKDIISLSFQDKSSKLE